MNKHAITILAVTILFVTLAVASAQAQDAGNMTVTIPFDFAAGDRLLPAGDYRFRRSLMGPSLVMQLWNSNNSEGFFLSQTHPLQTSAIQSISKLVFNRYGNQYFLSQVWLAGRSTGDELTKTSRERVLQLEMVRREVKPERIVITAKTK